ncbi:MAG TPA: hypothetical protein VER33_18905 [Polyangiaceae bacterium]|nr:hypothetical protein [Polyangiaceae bacterium]
MNLQWLLAVAGIGLLVAGLYLFATKRGMGGPAKLKLPFVEAELPVASLVPMVLGAALLLVASQAEPNPIATADAKPELPPGGGPRPRCIDRTAVGIARLQWAPADCPTHPGAPVRIDRCEETRPLKWLKEQLGILRAAKVRGFDSLPEAFDLVPGEYLGKKDWLLRVRLHDGSEPYNVSVGYNVLSAAKDGCLSLTKRGKPLSPFACMDTSGQWWTQNADKLCRVGR